VTSDAITALHSRVSVSRLTDPAPSDEVLHDICRAALRAADHALLRPWRFLLIRGDSRHDLAELFARATQTDKPDVSAAELDSQRGKPMRAPLIIVGIASPKDHPKVPVAEQHLSAGAALQNMLNAAHALDVGAIWRTGPMATHPVVREGLGLDPHETIIGFVYMGTIDGPRRIVRDEPLEPYFQDW